MHRTRTLQAPDPRRRLRSTVDAFEIATMTPHGGISNQRFCRTTQHDARQRAIALVTTPQTYPIFRRASDPSGLWWQVNLGTPLR